MMALLAVLVASILTGPTTGVDSRAVEAPVRGMHVGEHPSLTWRPWLDDVLCSER